MPDCHCTPIQTEFGLLTHHRTCPNHVSADCPACRQAKVMEPVSRAAVLPGFRLDGVSVSVLLDEREPFTADETFVVTITVQGPKAREWVGGLTAVMTQADTWCHPDSQEPHA